MRDEAAATGLLEQEEETSKAFRPVAESRAAGTGVAGVPATAKMEAAAWTGVAV
jgi:hypothetical protein